jgi:hypothetical protein
MWAALDGLNGLHGACVGCSELPQLPNKKSNYHRRAEWKENVGFWVDDAAKTITLEDGTPLIVRRFDVRWIGAARDDVSYELDRQDGNLAYASSTTKDGVTTIIIGYGRCKPAAGPAS